LSSDVVPGCKVGGAGDVPTHDYCYDPASPSHGVGDDNHDVYSLTVGFTLTTPGTRLNQDQTEHAEDAHECARLCAAADGCAKFSFGVTGGVGTCRLESSPGQASVTPYSAASTYTLDSRYVCEKSAPPARSLSADALWAGTSSYVRGETYPVASVSSVAACEQLCDAHSSCKSLYYGNNECFLSSTSSAAMCAAGYTHSTYGADSNCHYCSDASGAICTVNTGNGPCGQSFCAESVLATPTSTHLFCKAPTAELEEEATVDKTCTSGIIDYSTLERVSSTRFERGDTNGFSGGAIFDCGGSSGHVLQGHDATIQKDFAVDSGSTYEVTLDLYKLDSWDKGETAEVSFGGALCWKVGMSSNGGAVPPEGEMGQCPSRPNQDGGWADWKHEVRCRATASSGTLTLSVTSDKDQGAADESFAVDNVVLSREFADAASVSLLDCKQRCRWTDGCAHYDYVASDRNGKGACQLFSGSCANKAMKTGAELYSLHASEVAPLRGAFSITDGNAKQVVAYMTPTGKYAANHDPTVDLSDVPVTLSGPLPKVKIGNGLLEFRSKWRIGATYYQFGDKDTSCATEPLAGFVGNALDCAERCSYNSCSGFSVNAAETECRLCGTDMAVTVDQEGHTTYGAAFSISHVSGKTAAIFTNQGELVTGPSRYASAWYRADGVTARPLGAARNINIGDEMLSFGGGTDSAPFVLAQSSTLKLEVANVAAQHGYSFTANLHTAGVVPTVNVADRHVHAFEVAFKSPVYKGCGPTKMRDVSSCRGTLSDPTQVVDPFCDLLDFWDQRATVAEAKAHCVELSNCVQIAGSKAAQGDEKGSGWYFYRRAIKTSFMDYAETSMQCLQVKG
jgi:hypothetical protein